MRWHTVGITGMLFLCFSGVWAAVVMEPAEIALKNRMDTAMDSLDSSKALATVPWEEYVVLLYENLQGRAPEPDEFAALCGLRTEIGLCPSEALSLVLRGEEPCPTYAQIGAFLDAPARGVFHSTARSRAVAQALTAACAARDWDEDPGRWAAQSRQSDVQQDPPGIAYQVYFGYAHAHCRLSDGIGEPAEAYAAARERGLDFFALTDHGELLMLWPWEDKYGHLLAAADAADDPGRFAALYGFEWSNPVIGHVNVINTRHYTHCIKDFSFSDFYGWLERHPEGFGRFNHPSWPDPVNRLFFHGRLFAGATPQMVGMELWNEDAGFDEYYYGNRWTEAVSNLDALNRQGWRLGALGGEDDHRANWGLGHFRTGVLAEELSRDAIADAYRHRRFYSTEDKDLRLDFRCAGYPMGSVVSGVPPEFHVTASDDSGDGFQEIRLYRNGELLETRGVEGNPVNADFTDPEPPGDAYYYVVVRQSDDNDSNGRNDEAISSPIWVGEPLPIDPPPPPGCMGAMAGNAFIGTMSRVDRMMLLAMLCMLCLYGHTMRRKNEAA